MKIVWRVDPRNTRPLETRKWPAGFSDSSRAFILCSIESDSGEEYVPSKARNATHGPLRVKIAKYSEEGGFRWLTSKSLYATLDEAKEAAETLLSKNKEMLPPALRAH